MSQILAKTPESLIQRQSQTIRDREVMPSQGLSCLEPRLLLSGAADEFGLAAPIRTSLGTSFPREIAVADFNRDGADDIAGANRAIDSIGILINRRDGTFATVANYAALAEAEALKAADLNGDGYADLVFSDPDDSTIGVMLNQGDGTFGAVNHFNSGEVLDLAIADMNNDDIPDLVAGRGAGNALALFLGTGTGTFTTGNTYPLTDQAEDIAAGDLDGDGNIDLAVGNETSAFVSIILGNGDGTLDSEIRIGLSADPLAVALADVNRDGDLDVITGQYDTRSISILIGNGNGSFASPVSYSQFNHVLDLVVDDFNGDGVVDVATVNFIFSEFTNLDEDLSIFPGVGDGTFNTPLHFDNTGQYAPFIDTGDFNEDGFPDVATTNTNSGDTSVFLNEFVPDAVPVVDFDGDGKTDLVWRNQSDGRNVIWIMDGQNVTETRTLRQLRNTDWELSGAADFDRDGNVDLWFKNAVTGRNTVWFLDADQDLIDSQVVAEAGPDWRVGGFGDFNSDGRQDVFWEKTDGRRSLWYLGGDQGISTIDTAKPQGLNADFFSVTGIADFDQDGDPDVIYRRVGTPIARVSLMNDTLQTSVINLPDYGKALHLAVTGDFDGDGRLDFFWRRSNGVVNRLWLGTDTGDGSSLNDYDLRTVNNVGVDWQLPGTSIWND